LEAQEEQMQRLHKCLSSQVDDGVEVQKTKLFIEINIKCNNLEK